MMNDTDPLRAWRPADSDAQAEWTPAQRAEVLARILATPRSVPTARQITASRGRSRVIPALACIAAAAAAVIIVSITAPAQHAPKPAAARSAAGAHSVTAASRPTIGLAGYEIVLSPDEKTGRIDTDCTADLHLTAGQARRLITTRAAGCPLRITSVVRTLPADARPIPARQMGPAADFTSWSSRTTGQFYIPAKLPSDSTVYVTIDQGKVPISVQQQKTLFAQLSELANGMQVSRP